MNITDVNYNSNLYSNKNINFTRYYGRGNQYTTAVEGEYLPKNRPVYVEKDAVLSLAPDPWYPNESYLIGLDSKPVKNAFKRAKSNIITIGLKGNVVVPEKSNEYVSRHHLELRKQGSGYLVTDVSTNGTILTKYKDYTDKPFHTPIGQNAMINKDATLNLGHNYMLGLNSPNIYRQISHLDYGREYTLGREGDIVINNNMPGADYVSREHLKFKKFKDYYVISDNSMNGTYLDGCGKYPDELHRQERYNSRSGYNDYHVRYNPYINQPGISETLLNQVQNDYPEISKECRSDLIAFLEKTKKLDIKNLTPEENKALRREYLILIFTYHPDNLDGFENDFLAIQDIFKQLGLIDEHNHWNG